jgi:transposase-like protein
MPRKTYGPEQLIGMLREADVALGQGRTVGEMCRDLGITSVTYYRWRKEYGGPLAQAIAARRNTALACSQRRYVGATARVNET